METAQMVWSFTSADRGDASDTLQTVLHTRGANKSERERAKAQQQRHFAAGILQAANLQPRRLTSNIEGSQSCS